MLAAAQATNLDIFSALIISCESHIIQSVQHASSKAARTLGCVECVLSGQPAKHHKLLQHEHCTLQCTAASCWQQQHHLFDKACLSYKHAAHTEVTI